MLPDNLQTCYINPTDYTKIQITINKEQHRFVHNSHFGYKLFVFEDQSVWYGVFNEQSWHARQSMQMVKFQGNEVSIIEIIGSHGAREKQATDIPSRRKDERGSRVRRRVHAARFSAGKFRIVGAL